MSKETRTPGPWKVVMPYHNDARATCRCVQCGKDDRYTTSELLTADARFIVRAENCFDEMLTALKLALPLLETKTFTTSTGSQMEPFVFTIQGPSRDAVVGMIKHAIQKATGEQP